MRVLLRAANVAAVAAAPTLAAGIVLGVINPAEAQTRTVRLDAVIAKGGPPINDEVKFAIWSLNDGDSKGVIARRAAAPAEVALQPGEYRIVAEYGSARRVQDIRVEDAPSQRQMINLNAGEVELSLVPRIGAPAVRAPMMWEVRRYARGEKKGATIASVKDDRPHLMLREGWYEVEVRHGNAAITHTIEVAAGQRYDYTLVMSE